MATTKWEVTEKIIRRMAGWTERDYAKFYALPLLSQGYQRATVDMHWNAVSVKLTAYRPVVLG